MDFPVLLDLKVTEKDIKVQNEEVVDNDHADDPLMGSATETVHLDKVNQDGFEEEEGGNREGAP